MAIRLSKRNKWDLAIVPQTINNTNVTGRYYDTVGSEFITAVGLLGAMAATKAATLKLVQATDEAGTGSKDITGATATSTAGAAATEATLALATVLAGDSVTINGLTFTAHATVTTAASRQFSISGSDSADADALVSLLNDATYGVPNTFSVNASGTITIRSKDGVGTITVTAPASTITVANTKGLVIVEITPASLDVANNFRYVAVNLATTANGIFAATLIRGGLRQSPTQSVGGSAFLL